MVQRLGEKRQLLMIKIMGAGGFRQLFFEFGKEKNGY